MYHPLCPPIPPASGYNPPISIAPAPALAPQTAPVPPAPALAPHTAPVPPAPAPAPQTAPVPPAPHLHLVTLPSPTTSVQSEALH